MSLLFNRLNRDRHFSKIFQSISFHRKSSSNSVSEKLLIPRIQSEHDFRSASLALINMMTTEDMFILLFQHKFC